MKKNTLGRLLSIAMTAAMVMGTLAGCGGSDGQSAADGGGSSDTQTDASSDAGEAADGVETFTIATVRWTDAWPNDFNQIQEYENYYHTGNPFLDVLIRDKAKTAQKEQIDFSMAITVCSTWISHQTIFI